MRRAAVLEDENPLPCAEQHAAIRDGNDFAGTSQQTPNVSGNDSRRVKPITQTVSTLRLVGFMRL